MLKGYERDARNRFERVVMRNLYRGVEMIISELLREDEGVVEERFWIRDDILHPARAERS